MNTQHIRPLWVGFVLCVLTPVLVFGVTFTFISPRVIVPFEQSMIVSLVGSLIVSLGIVLPYVLWLRRKNRLNAFRVSLAGAIAGGVVLGAFAFEAAYSAHLIFPEIQVLIKSAIVGAIIGLLAALVLCFGAGIPFSNKENA